MGIPAKVTVTEVALRDGLQNEDRLVSTAEKLRLFEALVAAGMTSVELGAFVRPDRVPQMADTEQLFAAAARPNSVVASALVLNARGAHRAIGARPDEVRLVVSAMEGHSQANSGRSVAATLEELEAAILVLSSSGARPTLVGCIATAFACPYDGPTPVARVAYVADRYASAGVDRLILADTIGSATPVQVLDGLAAAASAAPGLPLGLHLHNTYGMGLANAWTALQAGVDRFDTSLGGLGGCPFAPGATGNLATEDLVGMLHDVGVDTGIDLDDLLALLPSLTHLVGHPVDSHRGRVATR